MLNWASLLTVAIVSMAVAVAVVVLTGFALVGWSAHLQRAGTGGLGRAGGTALAVACGLAVLAITGYGLVLVISH